MVAHTAMLENNELWRELEWWPESYRPNADGGSGTDLAEFAGRGCYEAWSRPNPKTATNRGYLENIVKQRHFSVIEHASVSFRIEGVSRSLTHELVRHRHHSFSQLSQRYVDEGETKFIVPPLIRNAAPSVQREFQEAMASALESYKVIASLLTDEFPDKTRKEIRQTARAVLPNATETKLVITGNYRAWWELIEKRATEHADVEIRALAVEILRQLQREAPEIFDHFEIVTLPDGTEVAWLREVT